MEDVRKKARDEMRGIKERMEDQLGEYEREREKVEKQMTRELEEARESNGKLAELCEVLREQKEEVLGEMKRGKEEEGRRWEEVREGDRREVGKVQRQLERNQKELENEVK